MRTQCGNCISILSGPIRSERRQNREQKTRLLVQIERKRVSSERRPRSDIFDRESSVLLSALLTSRRAGRIEPGDFSSWLQHERAHIEPGVLVASLTD